MFHFHRPVLPCFSIFLVLSLDLETPVLHPFPFFLYFKDALPVCLRFIISVPFSNSPFLLFGNPLFAPHKKRTFAPIVLTGFVGLELAYVFLSLPLPFDPPSPMTVLFFDDKAIFHPFPPVILPGKLSGSTSFFFSISLASVSFSHLCPRKPPFYCNSAWKVICPPVFFPPPSIPPFSRLSPPHAPGNFAEGNPLVSQSEFVLSFFLVVFSCVGLQRLVHQKRAPGV